MYLPSVPTVLLARIQLALGSLLFPTVLVVAPVPMGVALVGPSVRLVQLARTHPALEMCCVLYALLDLFLLVLGLHPHLGVLGVIQGILLPVQELLSAPHAHQVSPAHI